MVRIHMLWIAATLLASGCTHLPKAVPQTVIHNPFPQLAKVAVAPFFNLTTEPLAVVDGREFGLAYYNELQRVPGFEVVPIGVVEEALRQHGLSLDRPDEARKLAQLLEVDAIAVGAVTDFHPYYPPRCALAVEWYAANPAFRPIPPGYGLPLGTPAEAEIPPGILFDAELAAARAQMDTPGEKGECLVAPPEVLKNGVRTNEPQIAGNAVVRSLPSVPVVSAKPVLRHVTTYNGHDPYVTASLAEYVAASDDARFGDWPAYLQRSDDFIRFCCYRHIHEMLSARGGAETQVVWRWPCGR